MTFKKKRPSDIFKACFGTSCTILRSEQLTMVATALTLGTQMQVVIVDLTVTFVSYLPQVVLFWDNSAIEEGVQCVTYSGKVWCSEYYQRARGLMLPLSDNSDPRLSFTQSPWTQGPFATNSGESHNTLNPGQHSDGPADINICN